MKNIYPIEQHAKITFDKIKNKAEKFEIEINKFLDKIHPLHLSDLPFIEIENELSYESLPRKISCIYFLLHDKEGLLYIGKTQDLYTRWLYRKSDFPNNPPDVEHHTLWRCMKLENVKLHWFEMSRTLATIIEPIVIKKLKPEWNIVLNRG